MQRTYDHQTIMYIIKKLKNMMYAHDVVKITTMKIYGNFETLNVVKHGFYDIN